MPIKNSVKVYEENGYYHVYNRGVEKRDIFMNDDDYRMFLFYLKYYLSDPAKTYKKTAPSQRLKNYLGFVDLICYCLMPNHYHLLIKQHTKTAMTEFIRSISTRYAMYFNKKYDRVGSLFQGKYKAVKINSEEQLVHLTHYIHRNPDKAWGSDPQVSLDYEYSSIKNYLGGKNHSWVKNESILDLFSKNNPSLSYLTFITDVETDPAWGSDP